MGVLLYTQVSPYTYIITYSLTAEVDEQSHRALYSARYRTFRVDEAPYRLIIYTSIQGIARQEPLLGRNILALVYILYSFCVRKQALVDAFRSILYNYIVQLPDVILLLTGFRQRGGRKEEESYLPPRYQYRLVVLLLFYLYIYYSVVSTYFLLTLLVYHALVSDLSRFWGDLLALLTSKQCRRFVASTTYRQIPLLAIEDIF